MCVCINLFTTCQSVEEPWEINSRIDGQLERAPESRVDFHQIRRAIIADLELNHGNAMPASAVKQGTRMREQYRIHRYTLG